MERQVTRTIVLGAALLLASVSVASAKTLSTPVLAQDTSNYFYCGLVNTGTKELTDVSLQIIEPNFSGGNVLDTNACPSVPGGAHCQVQAPSGYPAAYCVVNFNGSPKAARAALSVLDGSNVVQAIVPAVAK